MDKSQIRKRTKELLEKAEKPKVFTARLQELFVSCVDEEATKIIGGSFQILASFLAFHCQF